MRPAPRCPGRRWRHALWAVAVVIAALAEGAAMVIVPLIFDSGRPAKANLSLDSGLLQAIDEAAEARGLTRSAFIATAARQKIATEG